MKRYIRKGVPLEHRARVWMGVSGAQAQMDRNPGYYHRLLQGERNDSLEEAIRTGDARRPSLRWTEALERVGRTPEGSLFAPCLQSRGAMRELPLLKMRQLILIFSKENQNVGILRGEQCLELVQQIFERLAGW